MRWARTFFNYFCHNLKVFVLSWLVLLSFSLFLFALFGILRHCLVVSILVLRQWERACSSLKWKLEEALTVYLNLRTGALNIFISISCLLYTSFSCTLHIWACNWWRWYVPALNNKFLFVLLHALDVSHYAQPLHIECKIKLLSPFRIFASSFTGWWSPYLQFWLLRIFIIFYHCLDEVWGQQWFH